MTTRGERIVAMRDWGYAKATITRNEAGLRDRQKTVTGEPENRMGSDATGSNNGDGSAVAIRPSATVIIVRGAKESPSILMGQRSRSAVFMPDKFVFPGGAVDPADRLISLSWRGGDPSLDKLGLHSGDLDPRTIILSGIREVWEETGLLLATRDGSENGQSVGETQQGLPDGAAVPECWAGFLGQRILPSAAGMRFIFRAITPPGRPRRFDARFLMVDAKHILNDLDDFSQASGELSCLSWVPLADTTSLALPFITEVVLAELSEILSHGDTGRGIPFFHHHDLRSCVSHL